MDLKFGDIQETALIPACAAFFLAVEELLKGQLGVSLAGILSVQLLCHCNYLISPSSDRST